MPSGRSLYLKKLLTAPAMTLMLVTERPSHMSWKIQALMSWEYSCLNNLSSDALYSSRICSAVFPTEPLNLSHTRLYCCSVAYFDCGNMILNSTNFRLHQPAHSWALASLIGEKLFPHLNLAIKGVDLCPLDRLRCR